MQSKLMLLLAISRGAELLILDEPMEGMDPAVAEDVLRELVDLAAAEGTTIFFSSHQIADVEQIADHVPIIEHGACLVANTDMIAMTGHLPKIFSCGVGFYFLSTLFATFLEDPFHTIAAVGFPTLLMILNSGGWIPGYLNVIDLVSNGVTGPLAWIQMAACLALGGICLVASIRIVESQEY